jgi:2-polyprenyl-3-methyl-5-hydroxy-6-metoxy-1,4-benzoquinol methylase
MCYDYDGFLSYASADSATVTVIAERLRREGLTIWFDLWHIPYGANIPATIKRGIEASRCMILCVSAEYLERDWPQFEHYAATYRDPMNWQRRRITLVLQDVKLPDTLGMFRFIDCKKGVTDDVVRRLAEFLRGSATTGPNLVTFPSPQDQSFFAARRQPWLFCRGLYRVNYIPLINKQPHTKPWSLKQEDLRVQRDEQPYLLPERFVDTPLPDGFINDPKRGDCCRLSHYSVQGKKLHLTLAPTTYVDFLRSNPHMDDLVSAEGDRTLRDEFGQALGSGICNFRQSDDFSPAAAARHEYLRTMGSPKELFDLSNICGVGIFIRTRDGLVATEHSDRSDVYPGRLTYSASGTVFWGANPCPFSAVGLKAFDEIGHQVTPKALRLVSFGADARMLYFQFSFLETTDLSFAELAKHNHGKATLHKIPLEAERIAAYLLEHCWEPAAEATLLTICSQLAPDGRNVLEELQKRSHLWGRRDIREEWEFRSTRRGLLADMSVRYPDDLREAVSNDYVAAVLTEIRKDVAEKDVVEFGCGTGRITSELALLARKVTCIDVSSRMIRRNKERLGNAGNAKVTFIEGFAQDYDGPKHDVAICSLLLIHNTTDALFLGLVAALCRSAEIVCLFEDISDRTKTSPSTRLRSEKELLAAFETFRFKLEKQRVFKCHSDTIAFFRLAASSAT